MSTGKTISRGVIAGILAATAVAVWFLVVDALRGDPMSTPSFLAGVLADYPAEAEAGFGMIALYTVLHYVAFMSVGIAVAWALERTRTGAMLLLGLAVGVLLFDLVFYAGVIFRGVNIIDRLGWASLLSGSLVGGVTMLGWLQYASPRPVRSWRDVLAAHTTLRDGLVAGILGAAAVAIWFLIYDVATRQILFTPAALGSALFDGARGVDAVTVDMPTVLGYTALHFIAFLPIGVVAAIFASEAERHAVVLLGAVLLFVTAESLFLGLAAIVANWLLDALSWWNVIGANVVAALVMGLYLWKRHPDLAQQFRSDIEDPEEERVARGRAAAAPPRV